jgi:hypothetical protein
MAGTGRSLRKTAKFAPTPPHLPPWGPWNLLKGSFFFAPHSTQVLGHTRDSRIVPGHKGALQGSFWVASPGQDASLGLVQSWERCCQPGSPPGTRQLLEQEDQDVQDVQPSASGGEDGTCTLHRGPGVAWKVGEPSQNREAKKPDGFMRMRSSALGLGHGLCPLSVY